MTAPRQVLADRTYMFTRRCAERRLFLRPSKETNDAFVYCFALAVQRYGLEVYWLSVLSDHYHDGLRDILGNYPEFIRYFHSLLARCFNVHLGRWESFWSAEQTGALHLADAEAIFEKNVYSVTNPVKDDLVDKVANWPGFNSLPYQLSGKPVVVQRPKWFFNENGSMPKQLELRFKRPPEFEHLSQQEWADKLRAAVAEQERKAAAERQAAGIRVVGRKAILRRSPYSCAKSITARRGLRPRLATRNKWLRIELLQRNKQFQQKYREAYERRRRGELDVLFPYGTYQLAVQGLVGCEPPPALE